MSSCFCNNIHWFKSVSHYVATGREEQQGFFKVFVVKKQCSLKYMGRKIWNISIKMMCAFRNISFNTILCVHYASAPAHVFAMWTWRILVTYVFFLYCSITCCVWVVHLLHWYMYTFSTCICYVLCTYYMCYILAYVFIFGYMLCKYFVLVYLFVTYYVHLMYF